MKTLYLILFIAIYSFGLQKFKIQPDNLRDGKFMNIEILDSCIVDISRIDGEQFYGISGLAYDENRDVLYALNDRGRLFSLRVVVNNNKIIDIKPISGYRLKDIYGKKFLKPKSDSEGLAIVSDGDKKALLVSFERYPRVIKFDVKANGKKELNLPKRLQNIKNFQGKNGALEALTYHPKYGYLTTGEYPLKDQIYPYQGIYNRDGEVCRFKKDYFDNAITEFELMSDGNILVLQRDIDFKRFHINITLKKIYLDSIENGICRSKNLAILKSDDGWNLDNFEGLTHYKDNIYFMISDDNGNFFQKTILTMFKVLDSK